MNNSNYWTKTLSRRRAMRAAAVAGTGIAALSLVGCGGDDSDQTTANTDGPVTDSTKGKHGGSAKFQMSGPIMTGARVVEAANNGYPYVGFAYDALLAHKWGQDSVPAHDGTQIEPAVAAALPEQPDDLTYIFKIRPDVKFHNGRTMTAEDVAYSLDLWANFPRSTVRSRWQNWFEKIETPDAQTIVVKTKFPYGDTLLSMAGSMDGYILPKEHEESSAAGQKFIGTGPFIHVDTQEPLTMTFRRNPDYYLKPYPYFDEVVCVGAGDIAKRVADFVSKQIHTPWWVGIEDRDRIKEQRPDARLQASLLRGPSLFMRADMAPFNDKRVRQALSMSIDRNKVKQSTGKGEGKNDQYFNVMYKDLNGTREVSELPQAKYWDYNITEAKRLLSAAGITRPIETPIYHWPATVNGQWFVDIATLTAAGWKENGIADAKPTEQLTAQFSGQTAAGRYEGMGLQINSGFSSGAPSHSITVKDKFYWGPNGEHAPSNNSYASNPEISSLAEKQLRTLKAEDRKAIWRQMEPLVAEEQYMIVFATTDINWFFDPSLRNAVMPVDQTNRRLAMRWWFA